MICSEGREEVREEKRKGRRGEVHEGVYVKGRGKIKRKHEGSF